MKVRKVCNGGSIEAAMEEAKQREALVIVANQRLSHILHPDREGPIMTDTLSETRRELDAYRDKYGADSVIGWACSDLIVMIANYNKETDRDARTRLAVAIETRRGRLGELLIAERRAAVQ